MMRCMYNWRCGRKLFYPAMWVTLRHSPYKFSVLAKTAWLTAGSSKSYATRFTSTLLDSTRGMATSNKNMEDRLVWIDMEMTGLEVDTCHIMEIACLITDSDLEIISEDFHVVVHQPDDVLASMNAWCVDQHAKTGLTAACRESKISLSEAEQMTYKFLTAYVPEKKCAIAGNSVWMDRLFLKKYMPLVDNYAHYRIVDVSTLKELTRRWCPEEYKATPSKKFIHRALDDIRESINELKYYKSNVFNR